MGCFKAAIGAVKACRQGDSLISVPRLSRFNRGALLLFGLQGGAILSIVVHPLLPLILSGGLITILILLYYSQVLLVLLANVGLVKGALISQFPVFESLDFTILVSMLTLLALAGRLADPDVRRHVMQFQYIIAAFVVWVVWMIISSQYAPRIDWALEKSFRFALFATILFLGPLLLIRTREESKAMLSIFLGVGFLGAFYIIGELLLQLRSAASLQGITRLSILSANPIGAGRVLSICAAMAAILIITKMGKARYWGPLMILFLVTALFTGSRGPVLGLTAAILLLGLFLGGAARRRTILILGSMIAAIGLVLILAPEGLTYRYKLYMAGELGQTEQGLRVVNTITHRIELWGKAVALWSQDARHTFIGAGTAGYANLFPWRNWRYPHNLPLEVLAEYGLLGVGVFGIHIYLAAKFIYSRLRIQLDRHELMWLAGLATYFFSTLVSGDLNDNRLLWFFMGGLLSTSSIKNNAYI